MYQFEKLSLALRFLSIDAIERAKSGHPGMPLGMSDIATVLFARHLRFIASKPTWFNRDRFIISNGHGCMLLYSLLYLTGYKDISIDDIKNFRRLGSPCAGHPEYKALSGIETTTGPLGQGLGNAVGMAIAEKHLSSKHSEVNHYTYVFVGDGDLMEGISHEACSLAGHLKLNKLIIFYDDNNITIDGSASLSCSDDAKKRFESYHFNVLSIDGHDYTAIDDAITSAKQSDKPTLIICKTHIGKGAFDKQDSAAAHGSPLGAAIIEKMRQAFDWPHPPFDIPQDILDAWRSIGKQHEGLYEDFSIAQPEINLSIDFDANTPLETRVAMGKVLEKLPDYYIGGSADLTPSNNTKSSRQIDFSHDAPQGTYIHYGVREHAMGAIANGLALHGGLGAYMGTFLVFSDYMRPSIRLAAIMKLPVLYIFTHDSIGLGEDGPTHQPVEHLASFRAMPNINVFRPADMNETIGCMTFALKDASKPSIFALTRQKTIPVCSDPKLCLKGGYIVDEKGTDGYVFIATGSEVGIALEVARHFDAYRVISMPCVELFLSQDAAYQQSVLGAQKRIIIEAASQLGWDRVMREGDLFFGMHSFGASGPYSDLYNHFGLSADCISRTLQGIFIA